MVASASVPEGFGPRPCPPGGIGASPVRPLGGPGHPAAALLEANLVYAGINRSAPPRQHLPASPATTIAPLPLRVALVLNTFSFGGSETEAMELIQAANP